MCNLAQSSALDFLPRGWPGETVNCPKCSRRTTRLVLKSSQPCPLVAIEGTVKVHGFIVDANMCQWDLRANNIFED